MLHLICCIVFDSFVSDFICWRKKSCWVHARVRLAATIAMDKLNRHTTEKRFVCLCDCVMNPIVKSCAPSVLNRVDDNIMWIVKRQNYFLFFFSFSFKLFVLFLWWPHITRRPPQNFCVVTHLLINRVWLLRCAAPSVFYLMHIDGRDLKHSFVIETATPATP